MKRKFAFPMLQDETFSEAVARVHAVITFTDAKELEYDGKDVIVDGDMPGETEDLDYVEPVEEV